MANILQTVSETIMDGLKSAAEIETASAVLKGIQRISGASPWETAMWAGACIMASDEKAPNYETKKRYFSMVIKGAAHAGMSPIQQGVDKALDGSLVLGDAEQVARMSNWELMATVEAENRAKREADMTARWDTFGFRCNKLGKSKPGQGQFKDVIRPKNSAGKLATDGQGAPLFCQTTRAALKLNNSLGTKGVHRNSHGFAGDEKGELIPYESLHRPDGIDAWLEEVIDFSKKGYSKHRPHIEGNMYTRADLHKYLTTQQEALETERRQTFLEATPEQNEIIWAPAYDVQKRIGINIDIDLPADCDKEITLTVSTKDAAPAGKTGAPAGSHAPNADVWPKMAAAGWVDDKVKQGKFCPRCNVGQKASKFAIYRPTLKDDAPAEAKEILAGDVKWGGSEICGLCRDELNKRTNRALSSIKAAQAVEDGVLRMIIERDDELVPILKEMQEQINQQEKAVADMKKAKVAQASIALIQQGLEELKTNMLGKKERFDYLAEAITTGEANAAELRAGLGVTGPIQKQAPSRDPDTCTVIEPGNPNKQTYTKGDTLNNSLGSHMQKAAAAKSSNAGKNHNRK